MGSSSSHNSDKKVAILKMETWSRESHGLFDYENKTTNKKILHVIGTSSIFRTRFNEIICFPDWDDDKGLHKNEYQTVPILHFLFRNNNYWIYHRNTIDLNEEDDPSDRLWHVVKFHRDYSKKESGFRLSQDDIIKLGRVRFRITEVHRGKFQPKNQPIVTTKEVVDEKTCKVNSRAVVPQVNKYMKRSEKMKNDQRKASNGTNVNHQSTNRLNGFFSSKNSLENTNADQADGLKFLKKVSVQVSEKSEQQIICRICLSEVDEDEEEENPIISPCKCSGTMKYIHTECLKSWLNSKCIITKKIETEGSVSYIWRPLTCELCKTKFPDTIEVNNESVELFDIEKPEGPYLIVENISVLNAKAIHVIGMFGKDIARIGRGHN